MKTLGSAIVLCFLVAAACAAQESTFKVKLGTDEVIRIMPRSIVTAPVLVTNDSAQVLSYVSRVDLPTGWKQSNAVPPSALQPHSSEIILVSFLVPQKTLAGTYAVSYLVWEQATPSRPVRIAISVEVQRVRKISLRKLASPDLAFAGDAFTSTFSVRNEGNAANEIAVTFNMKNGVISAINGGLFVLPPGESRVISATVTMDKALTRQKEEYLWVQASLTEDATVKVNESARVLIIPRATAVADLYARIPMILSFDGVYMRSNGQSFLGFQPSISGQGALDERGESHIEFLLKPRAYGDPSLGMDTEEYRISLENRMGRLTVGDSIFSLSPLTDSYFLERGLEAVVNLSSFVFGGYVIPAFASGSGPAKLAAQADVVLSPNNTIGLNYLYQIGSSTSSIGSVEGHFALPSTQIDLEYARSSAGSIDSAYYVSAAGALFGAPYAFSLIHAGPNFPGAYTDMDYHAASLSVPVGGGLTASVDTRQELHNLGRGSGPSAAIVDSQNSLRLGWESTSGLRLAVTGQQMKNLMPENNFDYRTESAKVEIGASLESLNLDLSGRFARSTELSTAQLTTSQTYVASAEWKNHETRSGRGFVSLNTSRTGGQVPAYVTAGMQLYWRLLDKTSLALGLLSSDPLSSSPGSQNLNATVIHTFANKSTITLDGKVNFALSSWRSPDQYLKISYAIPLSVPVTRITGVGTLKGFVYAQQTRAPLAGVVVYIDGITTLSDKDGLFTVAAIKTGTYWVSVDTTRIGFSKIPARVSPFQVTVPGGVDTHVEIPIADAASLFGFLTVYKFTDSSVGGQTAQTGSAVDYGIANTVVQLRSDAEILTTFTDADGRFEFPALRPGSWTLTVSADTIPAYHTLDRETIELELAPGSRTETPIHYLPQKREIHMIDEGATLESAIFDDVKNNVFGWPTATPTKIDPDPLQRVAHESRATVTDMLVERSPSVQKSDVNVRPRAPEAPADVRLAEPTTMKARAVTIGEMQTWAQLQALGAPVQTVEFMWRWLMDAWQWVENALQVILVAWAEKVRTFWG